MKVTIAIATLITSLFAARLTAADSPQVILSVAQQFEQADVQLAIEQYKKLRMAAFDLGIKLNTEAQSDEQRKQLAMMLAQLDERAENLRAITIKKAEVAVANTK